MHDNHASAIMVDSTRAISLYGNRIENNQLTPPPGWLCTVCLDWFQRARVAQTVVDHGPAAVLGWNVVGFWAWLGNTGARLQFDTTTVLGGGAIEAYGLGRGSNDTVGLRGVRAGAASGYRTGGIWLGALGHVEVRSIEVDSVDANETGLYGYWLGTFDIRDSRFTHVGGAVYAQADTATVPDPREGVFSGNFIECDTARSAVQYVVNVRAAPITIAGNTLQGSCNLGIVGSNSTAGAPQRAATLSDNVVLLPAIEGVTGGSALSLQGSYRNAVIARNTSRGIILLTNFGGAFDSVRVDSNTVQGTFRGGISLGGIGALTARGNVIDSIVSTSVPNRIAFDAGLTAGTNGRFVGNRVSRAPVAMSLSVPAGTDTTYLDSNVVVDSRLGVSKSANNIVGRWNYIARNDTGMRGAGYVRMDSSVFQQSVRIGARNTGGVVTWDLAYNFWGEARGPRCASGCDTASTGDSIIGLATFTPFLTAAPITVPTGVPPALARLARAPSAMALFGGARAGATRAVMPARRVPAASRTFVAPPPSAEMRSPLERQKPVVPEVIW